MIESIPLAAWHLETRKAVREFHPVACKSLFTSDGTRLLAAPYKALQVWDFETGEEIYALRGHRDQIRDIAVAPDGHRAVSASDDRSLRVWDLDRGAELFTLQGHDSAVCLVAITPDGRRAVSAAKEDRFLKIWDLGNGEEIHTLRGHEDRISSFVVTADGKRLGSVSGDNTLRIWNLESGELEAVFDGEGPLVASAYAASFKTFVVGETSGRLHFLRLENVA